MNKIKTPSLASFLASFFFIGYIRFAPGTMGSIIAFPVYFIISALLVLAKGKYLYSIFSFEIINLMFFITTILFFIGAWAAEKYSMEKDKLDPSEVVIDEVVAQMFAIGLTISLLKFLDAKSVTKLHNLGLTDATILFLNMVASLILFRVFDITKPWPINIIDNKIKNGFGVMLDDVAAALFAVIVHFFILFSILDRL